MTNLEILEDYKIATYNTIIQVMQIEDKDKRESLIGQIQISLEEHDKPNVGTIRIKDLSLEQLESSLLKYTKDYSVLLKEAEKIKGIYIKDYPGIHSLITILSERILEVKLKSI